MANFVLTPAQDIITGTSGDDVFFANGASLTTGDQINGGAGFDIFNFSGTATQSFAGFQLNGIERFDAFVASGASVNFDMSGSNNVAQLILRFAEGSARWENVDLTADDIFAIDTVGTADLFVDYVASQVTGTDDVVKVFVDSAGLDELDIEAGNILAIEQLDITAIDGSTFIRDLDSRHTTLNFFGTGDITIDEALRDTLKTVDASGLAGDFDIDTTGNDGATEGVTITGSAGVNTIATGEADDTVTTFDDRDKIVSEGGDDIIRAGANRDAMIVKNQGGPEAVSLFGEGGNDIIDLKDDFDADDVIDGGVGNDELRANGNAADADFAGVTSVEIYTQNEGGSSTLGAMAQAAGVSQIRFDRTGNEDNTIDASAMTNDLKFVANYINSLPVNGNGETDTLTGGSGNDLFNMAAGFDTTDSIDGGAGTDEIKVRGDTTVNEGDFVNVEMLTLGSAIGDKPGDATGNQYDITIDATNAPTAGGTLVIDGSELQAASTGFAAETLTLAAGNVVDFSLDVTGGAADDVIEGGGEDDILRGGDGDDVIRTRDGQDDVYGGGGQDDIRLVGSGGDTVHYLNVSDSSPSAGDIDRIFDWDNVGADALDLTMLEEAAGLATVSFLGNYNTVGDAQADTTSGSGVLQVAYVTDGVDGILYVDANDDGVLNGDDLQIFFDGETAMNNQDVGDGDVITATAAPAPIMEAVFLPETSFPVDSSVTFT